jgi:arginine/lysine/ornithine decarboxylase
LNTDLTELPGLDDLSNPTGVLANLNHKASRIWNTRSSLISVNGASAGIIAAILSVSAFGKKIVVSRNAHKSVITGLLLSGLEPIWYTPEWNSSWGVFDHVAPSTLASLLERQTTKKATKDYFQDKIGENQEEQEEQEHQEREEDDLSIAGVVVVSPTYGGAYSDIKEISAMCKRAGIALIVDEAHGAHRFSEVNSPRSAACRDAGAPDRHSPSAIEAGADIVIHSLHKTLGAMTQTGLVHLPHGSKVTEANLSHHLNMLQSTSPSYTLMLSIEDALDELRGSGNENGDLLAGDLVGDALRAGDLIGCDLIDCDLSDGAFTVNAFTDGASEEIGQVEGAPLQSIDRLARNLRLHLTCSKFEIYDTTRGTDSWHILLRHERKGSGELFDYLLSRGIYPECELGAGVLLMLGVGTSESDVALLIEALNDFERINRFDTAASESSRSEFAQPPSIEQVMVPRTASMALSEQVAIADAENVVASECIAPCPPGIPLCVPGQRLTKEVLNQITKHRTKDHVRIVLNPQPCK